MRRFSSLALAVMTGLWLVFSAACSSDSGENARKQPTVPAEPRNKISLAFNGGPPGGTFNYLANKISYLISSNVEWIDMVPRNSGGSMSNICALNFGQADMAILYAGDAFLGRNGQLKCPDGPLDKVLGVAYLYGAPAQLVVREDSGIETVLDLKGKIVAVGNPGSGAALSAERFFKHLGLWDDMDHLNHGYSKAAEDFGKGLVDAFWVLVGYPNASVIQASTHAPIKIIDLHTTALSSGFYDLYPFYASAVIPAGTYEGQTKPVATFQDSAIWCARTDLEADAVFHSLETIFNEKGLKEMRRTHKAARSMSEERALNNLSVPLHPGAARFWSEKGKDIPANLLPPKTALGQ